MTDNDRLMQIMLDVHSGLPRQGPGDDESTLRALSFCTELPMQPAVLDVGCGPGMQTVALARGTDGTITAVDLFEQFLDDLRDKDSETTCLRPLGLCDLGGCCDVCWYRPDHPRFTR